MPRSTLIRQFANEATQALHSFARPLPAAPAAAPQFPRDLYVWFEDTSEVRQFGTMGIAGLPESLLPASRELTVVQRCYAPGHPHLLTAVRLRCTGDGKEPIAAIYTAALSLGTVAWVGTGARYEEAWNTLYGEPEPPELELP
jgi:hypothetical protein